MNQMKSEDGYTLLETVVAMALFVGVLIPIALLIGDFTLDRKSHHLGPALRLAQTEITRIVADRDYTSATVSTGGYSITRTTQKIGLIVRINVRVYLEEDSGIPLCALSKSILDCR